MARVRRGHSLNWTKCPRDVIVDLMKIFLWNFYSSYAQTQLCKHFVHFSSTFLGGLWQQWGQRSGNGEAFHSTWQWPATQKAHYLMIQTLFGDVFLWTAAFTQWWLYSFLGFSVSWEDSHLSGLTLKLPMDCHFWFVFCFGVFVCFVLLAFFSSVSPNSF